MLVTTWVDSVAAARMAERELIMQNLAKEEPELLNVEGEILRRQLPLRL